MEIIKNLSKHACRECKSISRDIIFNDLRTKHNMAISPWICPTCLCMIFDDIISMIRNITKR